MSSCKIYYMYVVSYSCTIFGRPTVAKNLNVRQLSNSHLFTGGKLRNCQLRAMATTNLTDIGHQIVGNSFRVFSNFTAWVCSYGVEVAQQNELIICMKVSIREKYTLVLPLSLMEASLRISSIKYFVRP